MTRHLEIENVDPGIEKLIVTGMVVNDKFLGEIYDAAKTEYFKGEVTAAVATWCREFYNDHKEAPKGAIWDVLQIVKDTEVEDDDDRDFIESITMFLEQNITNQSAKTFNAEYVLRKGFKYLQLNSITVRIDRAQKALRRDDPDEAAKILDNAAREIFEEQPKPIDVPDLETLREMYNEDRESIMEFPGPIGDYLRPIRRSKMVAMLGPTKRGKSHWLVEWAFHAVLCGLKVMFFSLELTKYEILALLATRWMNKEISEEGGGILKKYQVPVFDCKHNQTGECDMDIREAECPGVIDPDNNIIDEFEDHPDHIPCTACRNHEDPEVRKNFEVSSWKTEIERETMRESDLEVFTESMRLYKGGGSLKLQAWPIGTATMRDVESSLDKEEYINNWIADVVIIDSADNFRKDQRLGDRRFQLGDIWEQISKLAKSRNILTVTASQGNRPSAKKDRLEQGDISEDFSKIMTVDALFAINERGHGNDEPTLKDKYWGRQQIETLASRYKKFVEGQQVMVLNNFDLGQVLLDSEKTWYKKIGE